MVDKECRTCGFDDEDYGCTCPHADKWYACPIENTKPENIQALKEYAEINMKKVKESFNTKYSTWIIVFCPDINSFFVTNERHFFWESEEEFDSEEAGIYYFEHQIQRFINVANQIVHTEKIWLENTQKWYT